MNNEHFFDVQINNLYIIIAVIGALYIFLILSMRGSTLEVRIWILWESDSDG